MTGFKHLIQCHCVLPQYRKMREPIFHKFVVFSVIGDDDKIIAKIVECNNCSAIHKITEIGKSSIAVGKDDSRSIITKDDIKHSIPENVRNVLESYNCDLATWEQSLFTVDNSLWGSEVILTKEFSKGEVQGKLLRFTGPGILRIEAYSREEEFLGK